MIYDRMSWRCFSPHLFFTIPFKMVMWPPKNSVLFLLPYCSTPKLPSMLLCCLFTFPLLLPSLTLSSLHSFLSSAVYHFVLCFGLFSSAALPTNAISSPQTPQTSKKKSNCFIPVTGNLYLCGKISFVNLH